MIGRCFNIHDLPKTYVESMDVWVWDLHGLRAKDAREATHEIINFTRCEVGKDWAAIMPGKGNRVLCDVVFKVIRDMPQVECDYFSYHDSTFIVNT